MQLATCVLLSVCVFPALASEEASAESHQDISVDANTKLIFVGSRHGNRNPGQLFEDDPNQGKWALEGAYQLTAIGKQQAYALGQSVRERYADFLPDFPDVEQVKALSSSAERCQMTLQMVLAGAFPPVEDTFADWDNEFDKPVNWQPIPYTVDNPMLRMYAVSECEPQKDAWKPVDDDQLPYMVDTINENKELFDYLEEKTGWNITLSNMGDIGDIVFNVKLRDLIMPDWIDSPSLEGAEGSLYEELKAFQEFHQIACAKWRPCAYMMAGYWLNHIVENLKKKNAGEDEDRKAFFYASHSEITLSAMRLMHADLVHLPTSAGFVLEFRDAPEPAVRFLHHYPDSDDFATGRKLNVAKLFQSAPCYKDVEESGWCPLDKFLQSIKRNTFDDWKAECGLDDENPQAASGGQVLLLTFDCGKEADRHDACGRWKANSDAFCDQPDSKFVLCRKTCLCGGGDQ